MTRPALSPRQREIMRLLSTGSTAKEIADRLACGEPSVRKHVRIILQKMQARTTVQAMWRWAVIVRKTVKATD